MTCALAMVLGADALYREAGYVGLSCPAAASATTCTWSTALPSIWVAEPARW